MQQQLGSHLVLGNRTISTLDNILLNVPKVNRGWEFTPLATPLLGALDPDGEVLVHQEGLWTRTDPISSLSIPYRRPGHEYFVPRLITADGGSNKIQQNHTKVSANAC